MASGFLRLYRAGDSLLLRASQAMPINTWQPEAVCGDRQPAGFAVLVTALPMHKAEFFQNAGRNPVVVPASRLQFGPAVMGECMINRDMGRVRYDPFAMLCGQQAITQFCPSHAHRADQPVIAANGPYEPFAREWATAALGKRRLRWPRPTAQLPHDRPITGQGVHVDKVV